MDKPYGPAPMMATGTLLEEAVIPLASRSFLSVYNPVGLARP
jgi:hypothetical protein